MRVEVPADGDRGEGPGVGVVAVEHPARPDEQEEASVWGGVPVAVRARTRPRFRGALSLAFLFSAGGVRDIAGLACFGVIPVESARRGLPGCQLSRGEIVDGAAVCRDRGDTLHVGAFFVAGGASVPGRDAGQAA